MRRYALLGMLGCLVVSSVQAGRLTFVDSWSVAGQPVYGQSRAVLSTTKPQSLRQAPDSAGQPVRYGLFNLVDGTGKSVSLIARLSGTPPASALLVDSNMDGILTEGEAAKPASLAERPAGFAEPQDVVWLARLTKPWPRVATFRVSPTGLMLVMAVRGAYCGQVPVGRRKCGLLVVDANADMWLSAPDYACLDTNADGVYKLDSEKRPDLSDIEAEEVAIRVPPASVAAGEWALAPKGEAEVTFTLGSVRRTPDALTIGLIRDQRHPVVVTNLEQPLRLPLGDYVIQSVSAKTAGSDTPARSYAFAHVSGKGFRISPGPPTTIDALGKVTLSITTSGEARPGENITVEVSVTTTTGLQLTGCTASDSSSRDGAVAPTLELRSPSGTVLDAGSMEYG